MNWIILDQDNVLLGGGIYERTLCEVPHFTATEREISACFTDRVDAAVTVNSSTGEANGLNLAIGYPY
jgi:hypothetical protein